MPQLSQLSEVILSQLFWLAITLGFIYFVIGRGMLPKIQSTVELRDTQIAEDLAAAEAARTEADEQAALLPVGGRRVAQRALEERTEDDADAGGGGADTDGGETGADDLG